MKSELRVQIWGGVTSAEGDLLSECNCTRNVTTFVLLFLCKMTIIKKHLKHRWLHVTPSFCQRQYSYELNAIFKQKMWALCLGIICQTEVLLKFTSWRCLALPFHKSPFLLCWPTKTVPAVWAQSRKPELQGGQVACRTGGVGYRFLEVL